MLLNFVFIQKMKWFVHYYGNGHKQWTETGGKRIAKEASPYFDKVITYQKQDLGETFLKQHQEHFQHKRGAGYWVWKPRCIQMTLEQMKDGDILMYADTGCEIRSDPQPLLDLLKEQDLICFHIEDFHTERKWNKRDLIIALEVDKPEITQSAQRLAGYSIIRKTPKTVAFINEWMTWASKLHFIDDSPSLLSNYPEFVEHRHDMSIWSLLTKKHGYKSYPDPGWPLPSAKIIAATRRQD
jgi:hypothetical protein